MLEEMRAFVLKNRTGNDVQRYYAWLVMGLISKVWDWEDFITIGKERVAISNVFLDIKKAVRW